MNLQGEGKPSPSGTPPTALARALGKGRQASPSGTPPMALARAWRWERVRFVSPPPGGAGLCLPAQVEGKPSPSGTPPTTLTRAFGERRGKRLNRPGGAGPTLLVFYMRFGDG